MALFDEVKTPFRWYDSRTKRHTEKRVCEGRCEYQLITPVDKLLPFQIFRPAVDPIAYEWVIKDADGIEVYAPDPALLQLYYFNDWNYIIYNGDDIPGMILPCGFYTSEITDGTNTWYSEQFYVTKTVLGKNVVKNHSFDNGLSEWTASGFTPGITGTDNQACSVGGSATLVQSNVFIPGLQYEIIISLVGEFIDTPTFIISLGGNEISIDAQQPITKFCAIADGTNLGIFATDFSGCINYITAKPVVEPIMLEWSNCSSIGNMYYGVSGFKNRFYFDPLAEVVQNEPKITKDGVEDNNKEFVQSWAKRITSYSIQAGLLPGYVIDALYEMIIHDTITLYLPNNQGTGTIKNVEINPVWSAEGGLCMAETTVIFQTEKAVITGCCAEEDLFNTCTMVLNIPFFEGPRSFYFIGYNEEVQAYILSDPISTALLPDFIDLMNTLALGIWTGVYNIIDNSITITVEQMTPTPYVFNYLFLIDEDTNEVFGYQWEDGTCEHTPVYCTHFITIDIGLYNDGADVWSYIGYGDNYATGGSVADHPIPGSIGIHDLAGLQTYLNSLNIGTWVVTNPSGSLVNIVNTQQSPPLYLIGDICADVVEPEEATVCFQFDTDCPVFEPVG